MSEKSIGTFRQILMDPVRYRDRAETNELAWLWLDLIATLAISPGELEDRMARYFQSLHGVKNNKKVKEDVANLKSALEKPSLTWNRFIQIMAILNPETIEITVSLPFRNGVKVESTLVEAIRNIDTSDKQEDD